MPVDTLNKTFELYIYIYLYCFNFNKCAAAVYYYNYNSYLERTSLLLSRNQFHNFIP